MGLEFGATGILGMCCLLGREFGGICVHGLVDVAKVMIGGKVAEGQAVLFARVMRCGWAKTAACGGSLRDGKLEIALVFLGSKGLVKTMGRWGRGVLLFYKKVAKKLLSGWGNLWDKVIQSYPNDGR